MQSFWQRLERVSLKVTPAALTALMVLLVAVPLRIPGAAQVMPLFTLINIFYWNMFFPGALPFTFLFALGLLEDSLVGLPLGVSSFVNIAFAFLMMQREKRHVGKALFTSVWFGFVSLSLAAVAMEWLVVSIYFGALLPVRALLLQWAATCLAYPPMHLALNGVYRRMHPS